MRFDGIWTPLITPHRTDHSIDEEALAALVEHLIGAGVHGLVVGGSTGEYYAQSFAERVRVMRLVRGVAAERVPLLVGTGTIRTEDAVGYARAAKEAGADALLVTTPPYAVPTERENALHALEIDRAADLPIMLYNYPARMGVSMGTEYLDRVGRSPNFRAIKESSGDVNRIHLLARDYPHIRMSCGMDDQALEFFAWGSTSWVCGGSNFLPAEHLALHRACVLEGDFAKGRRIMSALLPLMRVLEQGGKFVQCIKHGVEMAGLAAGPPRRPLRELTKDERGELERVVRTVRTTVAAIEAGSTEEDAR